MKTGERVKVLLFEDDYESMRDLKEHLEEDTGWEVTLSAEAGLLDRLKRERFDLVVVDLMVHPVSPNADGAEVSNVHFEGVNWQQTGLEFLRRLRRGDFTGAEGTGTAPGVPAIMLSAVGDDSIQAELKQDSLVEDYVEKPFRLEEFVRRIRATLDR